MATGLLWDERFLDHDPGLAIVSAPVEDHELWDPLPHAASPELVDRAYRLIDRSGLLSNLTPLSTSAAPVEAITRVHSPELVQRVKAISERGGGEAGEFAPAGALTYEVALLSAGGAIAAVDSVMSGRVHNAYALLRPPGHHATPDQAMGFCFFNNVAIAARHLQDQYGLTRVAIVDWDVHHGNGTQATFLEDPGVLFISVHQEDWFPADSGPADERGQGSGSGFTVNIPLPAGTGNAGYLSAFDRVIIPVLRTFQPEFILVSAGQDASGVDPLARMSVSSSGFRMMAASVQALANEICEGRLVACHEGGYSQGYSPVCTHAVVEGLSDTLTDLEDPYEDWLGNIAAAKEVGPAAQAIDQVVALHRKQWSVGG